LSPGKRASSWSTESRFFRNRFREPVSLRNIVTPQRIAGKRIRQMA
jgi:hypothetical protein